MPDQMSAVRKGPKLSPNYGAIIEAKRPYLWQNWELQQRKNADEANLSESRRQSGIQQAYYTNLLEQQRKQAKEADLLGKVGLGVQAGLGAANLLSNGEGLSGIVQGVKDAGKGIMDIGKTAVDWISTWWD